MRRAVPVALGLLLLTVSAQALPVVPAPPTAAAPTFAQAAADPLRAGALAASLGAAVAGAGFEPALAAVLRAQGFQEQALPVAPRAAPPGMPADLAAPVARLLGAIEVAERLRAEALAGLSPAEQARALDLLSQPGAPPPFPALPAAGAAKVAGLSAGAWAPDPTAEALLARVDVAKFRVAALTILAAIDASAPELRAAGLGPTAELVVTTCPGVTGTIVAATQGCQVIVTGAGPNTYAPPAAPILLIDQGGSDTYTNGAGLGAVGVSVVVDVAGNDVYTQAAAATAPGVAAQATGQGVGVLGVGVLADLAGDDVYTATATTTAPQPGAAAGTARALAQGATSVGAGVLADGAGRDRFTATASSSGGAAQVTAQGQGNSGVGALLNLGNEAGADDTYTASAASLLHLVSQTTQLSQYTIGSTDTQAQGAAAIAGVGVLADAGGNDAYTALSTGGVATGIAQGGAATGAGAFVDALGNDNLVARAVGDTTLTLITTDPGLCWTVTVTVTVGDSRMVGQGAAATGAGALVDGAGNDVRDLLASSRAGAIGEARSNFDCPSFGFVNQATATATSGTGNAMGQGAVTTGAGVLVDALGNDVNRLQGNAAAFARAIAISPGADIETATASAGSGLTSGQGMTSVGAGLSADLDGADTYASTANSAATRVTGAGTTIATGARIQNVQGFGTGGGIGWLFDGAGADAYSTSPAGASGAVNTGCWSNGPNGRGRDWAALVPPGCV